MSELITKNEVVLTMEENAFEMYAFFNAGSSLVGDVNLNFVNDQIGHVEMDGSHIALQNAWKDHSGKVEKPFLMGFHLEDFAKKLNKVGMTDRVSLRFDPEKKKCVMSLIKENSIPMNYEIASIDKEEESINLESLNAMAFDNKVEVNMNQLKQIIEGCKSEIIEILVENNTLKFNDHKENSFQCSIPEEQLTWLDYRNGSHGVFAIGFLKNIIKCGNIFGKTSTKNYKNAKITLSIQSEAPLKIEASNGDTHFEYFLAPRVEEDSSFNDDDDLGTTQQDPITEQSKDPQFKIKGLEKESFVACYEVGMKGEKEVRKAMIEEIRYLKEEITKYQDTITRNEEYMKISDEKMEDLEELGEWIAKVF